MGWLSMRALTALLSGVLFGLGLILSGMTDPAKVLGFLDLAGAWDPSLALVMLGAIGAALLPFQRMAKRERDLLGQPLSLPATQTLDRPLILGAVVFGIGWGLAGYCPGPAVVASFSGVRQALLFTVAMLAGMALYHLLQRRARPR